jgi:succinate-semialdehyde dehydrogenase/glutarate-semialdehyde dehydrogenase
MANVINTISPVDGAVITQYREWPGRKVERVLVAADAAQQAWRRTGFEDRAKHLKKAAEVLRKGVEQYAELMAVEMGKPLAQGKAEVEKCASACDYYAEKGAGFLSPETIATDASKSFVAFEPLGVVLAVMPWNFPFWQVFRFAAPAVMAGNAGVLKHASNVFGCALAIEEIFRAAGFPKDLFRAVLVGSKRVKKMIQHPLVKAVTITGSTPAGKAVAAQAGAMVKKSVLELGGSDPYVVLEDCDLDLTVETCVASRLINTGQSCIAAKRFVVVRPLLQQFTERYVALMRQKKWGRPLEPGIDLGPMARVDLRDQLHDQVQRSVAAGAKLLVGGTIAGGVGAFYPPTVLGEVKPGMPAYDEELFGPAAAIIEAEDEKDAIRIANSTSFGLGAAVFTKDLQRGERIAKEELQAGACFVNAFVKSDPRLPFGGIKESGYGRELSSFGIREFVNLKTVWVK